MQSNLYFIALYFVSTEILRFEYCDRVKKILIKLKQ